jgi:hypothetical protein
VGTEEEKLGSEEKNLGTVVKTWELSIMKM